MRDVRRLAVEATTLLFDRPPRLGGTRLGVVDGPSGSGKSSYALEWMRALGDAGCSSLALFSSDEMATWQEPFDWFDRFDQQVLRPLATGLPGRVQLTDWSSGTPLAGRWRDVPVVDVLILEGVSSGRAALRGRACVTVWLSLEDRRERLERAVARDGESSRGFLAAWQDAEDGFFADDRPWERADLTFDVDAESV